MNPIPLLAEPVLVLLLKWTGLLALAWATHGLLLRRDARWRLILWRSMLCFSLLLPLFQYVELPGIRISVDTAPPTLGDPSNTAAITGSDSHGPKANAVTPAANATAPARSAQGSGTAVLPSAPVHPMLSGNQIILAIWMLGCGMGVLRLMRLQLALARLRRESTEPAAEIQKLAAQVAAAFSLRRGIKIRVSGAISSPFVCGLFRPAILLPQALVQSLSSAELRAVLNHEMAHLRRHDLPWCVAWQWLRAFGWFHPLLWRVPAAHTLACEQEADRVAAAQMGERDSYRQLLARLALKVLALPAVETRLTVNGGSQIARRLSWLGQGQVVRWHWFYSAAALSVCWLLFFIVAGCGTDAGSRSTRVNFKQVLVVVQDEDGKPVPGATVTPEGFRVKGIHGADAYPWRKDLFGPPEIVVTDSAGKAYIKYPVEGIPEEKEYTGKIFFRVTHPDYATARPQEYSVDTPEQPIQLTRGIRLQVSGYTGGDHQPVPELVPLLNEEVIHFEDWQKTNGNAYVFGKMSAGGHLLRLMGRLASGQIVYSDVQAFTAEQGKDYNFDLEMKPGIRLEGRLDDRVPRPVTNGRVLIGVRPKPFPAWTKWEQVAPLFQQFPNTRPWTSYRPIAPDGTFVFESVPPGELDVIVHGDGFASKDGGTYAPGFGIPQAFSLTAPTTKIEVVTEPTATLIFTAKTKSGQPIPDALVAVSPNVIRINGIFGNLRSSSETPFNQLAPLPNVPYAVKTDNNGVALIRNVPACTSGLEVIDAQYQVPLQEPKGWRDRHVRLAFAAGETNRVTMVLERKGTDFIGSRR